VSPARAKPEPSDPKIGIGYIRVSTEDQHLGPEAQREAIERWAVSNGVRVVEIFSDLGVSGGTEVEDRPGLLAAIHSLGVHAAGLLIVAKRDRLARDVMISAVIERLVERTDARIESADGAGNGTGPEAALMRAIIAAFAAYERALIRSRTKSALAVKRSRGERISGLAPFGSSFDEHGRVIPNVEERAIATRVVELHTSGVSLNEIARRLNAELVPCRGARWYAGTIQRIVRTASRR
jgi:DNA invertase Pin-like site-specific DNA recombinase